MKYSVLFLSIIFISHSAISVAKSEKEIYIETASQFQRWCRDLSYRHFKQKKQQAYNWTASTIRELNDYQTRGSWKVGSLEKSVFCQIRIGKKAKTTKVEIH